MVHPDLSRLSLAPTGAGQSAQSQRSNAQLLDEIENLTINLMQNLDTMERRVDQLLSIMLTSSPGLRLRAEGKVGELEARIIAKLRQDPAQYTERDRIRKLLEDDEWGEPITNHAQVVAQIKHTLRVLKGLGAVPTVQGEVLVEASRPYAPQPDPNTTEPPNSLPNVDDRVSPLMAQFEQKLAIVTAAWRLYADERVADWEMQLAVGVRRAATPEELQAAFALWKEMNRAEAPLTEEVRRAYSDVAVAGVVPHVESEHDARRKALDEAFVELEHKMRALRMPFVQKSVDPAYDFDESIKRAQDRLAIRRAQKRAN